MTLYNTLSVRSEYADQVIGRKVAVNGSNESDLNAPRLIILIHGFQNSQSAAHDSYNKFRAALRSALWVDSEQELGTFWEFHWPGNHPNTAVSLTTYGARVPDARESGRLLAVFLGKRDPGQEVFLIAHSLGCRVALEAVYTIKELGDDYHGAVVRGLFLMAAAVPVIYCVPQRDFESPLAGSLEYAFYSHKDTVLARAFPIGQQQYGEAGVAVGSYGEPAHRWAGHEETETNLRHKQYWGSFTVAERIGRYMGFAGSRTLPDLSGLPDWQEQRSENVLPDSVLPVRGILSR